MSLTIADLPALNATLNATAGVLLVTGYFFIRRGRWRAHRACMVAALCVSAAFFTSYLTYHFQVRSVPFKRTGPIRTVYFTILINHTLLAMTVPFLTTITIVRATQRHFDRHKQIAHWTLPI